MNQTRFKSVVSFQIRGRKDCSKKQKIKIDFLVPLVFRAKMGHKSVDDELIFIHTNIPQLDLLEEFDGLSSEAGQSSVQHEGHQRNHSVHVGSLNSEKKQITSIRLFTASVHDLL